MQPFLHFIFNATSTVAIILAAAYSVLALRRFLNGDFFNIVQWTTFSYVLLAVYKVTEDISSRIVEHAVYEEAFMYIKSIFFLAGVICVFRAAYLMYYFSKIYGFKNKKIK